MDEKTIRSLNEGRRLRLEYPALSPVIVRRKESVLGRLVARFREGKTDFVDLVAELAVLTDIEQELTRRIKETEKIEETLYGQNPINT